MSVRKSLAWSYGAQAFIFILTFAVSVVVARLLGPYEMGIFAVGLSTSGALSILSSFGVGPYLVRHEAPDASVKATVFTVNAVLNVIVSVAILVIAMLGPVFGLKPEIRQVLLLLAIPPLIGIFDFLPGAFLQREMNFRLLSIIGMGRSVVTSMLLLGMAWFGLGYLSPAIAMVGSSLFGAVAVNLAARQHVSVRLGTAGWRTLTKFGMQMMSIGGLAMLVQRVSELILGHFLGLAALGIYTRASSLANQIWDNVYGLSTRVIFSQMASEMRDTGTVRATFLHGLTIITALVWPMLLGIAVLSLPLIQTLYGDKWIVAAVPLSILMLSHFVGLGFGMNWELCVLRDRTGWQARNETIRAVIGLVAFTIGAFFSLVGAASARIFDAICGLFLYVPSMREMAGTAPGEISRVYRQSGVLSVLAVAPALLLMIATGWSPHTSWAEIAGAIAAGIALWGLALKYFRHPLLDEFARALRAMRAMTGRTA